MPSATLPARPRHPHWLAVLRILLVIGTASLVIAMFAWGKAAPERETLFERLQDRQLRQSWDLELVQWSRWMLYANLGACGLALLIDGFLHRDRSDRYAGAMVLLMGLSLVGLFLHMRTMG